MSYHCPNCGKKNRVSYNFCYRCGNRLKYLHLKKFKEKTKEKPKEFQVNKYIILKLERDITIIYIDNKKFTQCKYLLIDIHADKIEDYDDITSIDDASEKLDHSLEDKGQERKIPVEVEFWGHCSNLQVWAEHNYDTRLLHSNLAFPLLKKLTDVGDPIASRVFKEEIAKRFEIRHDNVINFLINQNYLEYFNKEESQFILENLSNDIISDFDIKYRDLLLPIELKSLLDIIVENLPYSKPLKLKRFQHIGQEDAANLIGFSLIDHKVSKVFLFGCDIKKIPNSINNLEQLRELYLMGNSIKKIPKSIGNLKNLKKLFLSDNKLVTLPDSIGNLNTLEILKIDTNQLKELPESFCKLEKLKTLSLWGNNITELPSKIGDLKDLEICGLSHNLISNVPSSFTDLSNLHTLDLSYNKLNELPNSIGLLKNLKIFWLNNNRLGMIPNSIVLLKNLKQLYLFGNPITLYYDTSTKYIFKKLKKNGVNIK